MIVFALMLEEIDCDGSQRSLWSLYDDLDKAKKAMAKIAKEVDFEITDSRRFIIKVYAVK